jgi:plasmid stabilization system protein ParE
MTYSVIFLEGAYADLDELYDQIAEAKSPRVAEAYLDRIGEFCKALGIAPHRGEHRRGLKGDQRSIGFEHRISVVFRISDERKDVTIVGFLYAGRRLSRLANR